jgi:hypothetical protein
MSDERITSLPAPLSPAPGEPGWFVFSQGQQTGPFTREE